MNKKILTVVGITILFLGTCTTPSIAIKTPIKTISSGNTLYVGGTGEGNYTKIQDAINDAFNGDTVFVLNGTYYENVVVYKSIKLIGEDKNITVIDGSESGDVIYISSNYVNISNFMIRNTGDIQYPNYDAGIDIRSDQNTITGNIIYNSKNGIYLEGSDYNKILNNDVFNTDGLGIWVYSSSNNLLENNNIINDSYSGGILIHYLSNNNIIKSNYIANNYRDGISIHKSDNAIIEENYLLNNRDGISFYHSLNGIVRKNTFENCGIILESGDISYFNTHLIENNTVNGKPLYYYANKNGIKVPDNAGEVILVNCSNITVKNIDASNSSIGIEFGYTTNSRVINCSCNNNYEGIRFYYSENNTIDSSYIQSNSFIGISFLKSPYTSILSNKIVGNSYGIWTQGNNLLIKYNKIISSESTGIRFAGSDNLIVNNILKNNSYAIQSDSSDSSDNDIYHNNFINNTLNAYDGANNIWDNGYPSGGNYWYDYTGEDNNGDGIGDTPYPIPGGDNEDRYPLMEPWNLTYPVANFTYSSGESPVLFNGSSSYDLDGYIVLYDWDFGDGTTDTGEIVYHKYCDVGTYDVTLIVNDDDGLTGNITKCVEVILANIPPSLEIEGPNRGKPEIEYEYFFNVTDPDDDWFYIWIDWGDGDSTGWIGPYNAGVPVKLSHIWNETGTYVIKAKVKDDCGESEWAEFEVTIPRNKTLFNTLFLRLLERFFERFPMLEKLLYLFSTSEGKKMPKNEHLTGRN